MMMRRKIEYVCIFSWEMGIITYSYSRMVLYNAYKKKKEFS